MTVPGFFRGEYQPQVSYQPQEVVLDPSSGIGYQNTTNGPLQGLDPASNPAVWTNVGTYGGVPASVVLDVVVPAKGVDSTGATDGLLLTYDGTSGKYKPKQSVVGQCAVRMNYGGFANIGSQLVGPTPQIGQGVGQLPMRYDTVEVDELTATSGSGSANDRLVIAKSGLYIVSAAIYVDLGRSVSTGKQQSGGTIAWALTKNGGPIIYFGDDKAIGDIANYPNAFDIFGAQGMSGPIALAAGDYIQVTPYQWNNSATLLNGAMTNVQTTIAVAHDISSNQLGWHVGDVAWIMDTAAPEAVLITALSSYGATVTRGFMGTTAQAHATTAMVNRGHPWSAGAHTGQVTTLNGAVTSGAGTLTVNNPGGGGLAAFLPGDYVCVYSTKGDYEVCLINSTAAFGTQLNVTRGQQNTSAQAHVNGATVLTGRFMLDGQGFSGMRLIRLR